jgi:hypothetical protein
MKRTHIFSVALGITTLAGLLVSGAASASDRHTYHASFCQATNGVESDYNRSTYRITKTKGSGMGTLLCPINHDVFECSGWGGCVLGLTVDVNVKDWHSQGDVTCNLSVRNASGSSMWWNSDKTSGMAPSDTLHLSTGSSFDNNVSYILDCQIPTNDGYGHAKIYNYTVSEGS